MSDIKEIWNVFKMSNMQDKDMQAMFRRHATPNACIELLEEIERLEFQNKIQQLKTLASQYPNLTAAAMALKVHREQLKRLVDAGALCVPLTGEVWIMSKTKLKTENDK
jgi:ActR/RegA family two-component response regulator